MNTVTYRIVYQFIWQIFHSISIYIEIKSLPSILCSGYVWWSNIYVTWSTFLTVNIKFFMFIQYWTHEIRFRLMFYVFLAFRLPMNRNEINICDFRCKRFWCIFLFFFLQIHLIILTHMFADDIFRSHTYKHVKSRKKNLQPENQPVGPITAMAMATTPLPIE